MPLVGFVVNKNTDSSVQISSVQISSEVLINLLTYTSFGRMYNSSQHKFKLTCRTKHKKIARDSVPILMNI